MRGVHHLTMEHLRSQVLPDLHYLLVNGQPGAIPHAKGLVINYRECGGGGGGGGGYKRGKSRVRNFLRPPQDRVQLFALPFLKGGNLLRPFQYN